MNIITIHNLCNYLGELGIVDKKSINPFLSLYNKVINKSTNYNDSDNYHTKTESNIMILEIVLCSYLKKIFSIDKNYSIFSHKIIEKFKQNYLIKHYNGLLILFIIISKRIKYSIINSYFNIKKYFIKGINEDYNQENNVNKLINFNKNTNFSNDYNKNFFLNFEKRNNNENGNGINDNFYDYTCNKSKTNNNYYKNKIVNLRNEGNFNNYIKKSNSLKFIFSKNSI